MTLDLPFKSNKSIALSFLGMSRWGLPLRGTLSYHRATCSGSRLTFSLALKFHSVVGRLQHPKAAYRQLSYTSFSRRGMLKTPATALNRLSSIHRHFTMNAQELKNFFADSPPSIVNLVIKKHFDALTDQQARYAHYISRYE